jgi:hypothetical protein
MLRAPSFFRPAALNICDSLTKPAAVCLPGITINVLLDSSRRPVFLSLVIYCVPEPMLYAVDGIPYGLMGGSTEPAGKQVLRRGSVPFRPQAYMPDPPPALPGKQEVPFGRHRSNSVHDGVRVTRV